MIEHKGEISKIFIYDFFCNLCMLFVFLALILFSGIKSINYSKLTQSDRTGGPFRTFSVTK